MKVMTVIRHTHGPIQHEIYLFKHICVKMQPTMASLILPWKLYTPIRLTVEFRPLYSICYDCENHVKNGTHMTRKCLVIRHLSALFQILI